MTRTVARVLALVLTALAAVWFGARPQQLLVGTTVQPTLVPWWYQAAAFPPFFLLLAGFLKPAGRVARAVLLGGASAFALVRMAGLIPLSGHGLFLTAALVFTAREREERDVFYSALAALVLTAVSKWLWNDLLYFAASAVAGAALGAASRALAR